MGEIRIKRVYEAPSDEDGRRVLVDRLWPRGLGREAARIDDWLKQLAPSGELRRWFGHDPAKWAEFRRRYRAELESEPEGLGTLRAQVAAGGVVTLLYAAKDQRHNNAVVLAEYLREAAGATDHRAKRDRAVDRR